MVTIQRPDITHRSEGQRQNKVTPKTVLVIDESDHEGTDSLLAQLTDATGPTELIVTRHRAPSPVFVSGAGVDGPIMWSQSHTEHLQSVRRTDRRVEAICATLTAMGLGPVSTVNCMPTNQVYRSAARRQIDSVVRALGDADVGCMVVDPAHKRAAEIERALLDRLPAGQDITLS